MGRAWEARLPGPFPWAADSPLGEGCQGGKRVRSRTPGRPLPCLGLLGPSQVACGQVSGPCCLMRKATDVGQDLRGCLD